MDANFGNSQNALLVARPWDRGMPTFVGVAFRRSCNGWIILYLSSCCFLLGSDFGTHCGNIREFRYNQVLFSYMTFFLVLT